MRALLVASLWTASVTFVCAANGMTLRYALIIGNNVGVDADGSQPFPPLAHAEREAARIRTALIGLANFDSSDKRTRLLLGATKAEVKAAFEALSMQKQRDRASFGPIDTVFLLYFTGHGLKKRLLLADGPLASDALTVMLNDIGADFSIGVFDACHAGSFESVLREKGIRATPEFNLLKVLPKEVLSAKGSVWYVSSGKGQASYEDSELGGVFTHFFLESLRNARRDGPGITLESIWSYVREHTEAFAAARHRTQRPEQIIERYRSNAPVYFSFPVPRSATLKLTEAVEGQFALVYANGHLTEVFDKQAGERQTFAVYPGRARLVLLDGKAQRTEQTVDLPAGGTLVIRALPEPPPEPAIGERATSLFTKGVVEEKTITGTRLAPGNSLLLGAGAGFAYTNKELLHPRVRFALPVRLDIRRYVIDIGAVYGMDSRRYEAWNYDARMVGGHVGAGVGFDWRHLRLNLKAAFAFAHIWQAFDDQTRRNSWEYHPKAGVSVIYPRRSRFLAEFFVELGPLRSLGAGIDAGGSWGVAGGAGIALYYRLR